MAQKVFLKYQWMIFLVWQHPRGTFIEIITLTLTQTLLTLELTVNVFQSSGAFPLPWAPGHLRRKWPQCVMLCISSLLSPSYSLQQSPEFFSCKFSQLRWLPPPSLLSPSPRLSSAPVAFTRRCVFIKFPSILNLLKEDFPSTFLASLKWESSCNDPLPSALCVWRNAHLAALPGLGQG